MEITLRINANSPCLPPVRTRRNYTNYYIEFYDIPYGFIWEIRNVHGRVLYWVLGSRPTAKCRIIVKNVISR